MNGPVLIVETPNGDKEKPYRFLSSSPVSSREAHFFTAQGRQSETNSGNNYVAVSRKVTQRCTQRPGAVETIVLAGVQIRKLSEAHRRAIVNQLRGRFSQLDELVASIDWSKERGEVLQHSALDQWLREDFSQVPSVSPDCRYKDPCGKGRRTYRSIAILLGSMIIIGLFWRAWPNRRHQRGSSEGTEVQPKTTPQLPRRQESQPDSSGIQQPRATEVTPQLPPRREEDIEQKLSRVEKEIQKAKKDSDKGALEGVLKKLGRLGLSDAVYKRKEALEREINEVLRNLRWAETKKACEELMEEKKWEEAASRVSDAARVFGWKQLKGLKEDLKSNFESHVKYMVSDLEKKENFDIVRKSLQKYEKVPFIAELAGEALKSKMDELDACEDKFRYDQIRNGSIENKKKAVESYLRSGVKYKPMLEEVCRYKEESESLMIRLAKIEWDPALDQHPFSIKQNNKELLSLPMVAVRNGSRILDLSYCKVRFKEDLEFCEKRIARSSIKDDKNTVEIEIRRAKIKLSFQRDPDPVLPEYKLPN